MSLKNVLVVGGLGENSSKLLSHKFRINLDSFIHVGESFFISRPDAIKLNFKNDFGHETLNRYLFNFEVE